MIVTSGYNVYPSQIEEVIEKHEAVVDCSVIGIPHPYKVEVPKVYIALKKGYKDTPKLRAELTAQEKQQLLDKKTKEHRTVLENKKLDEIANNVTSFYDLNAEQTEAQISQIMDEYKNIEYEVPISTINQNNIIAVMFKAIQELSAKIDSLDKRLL